MYYMKQHNKIYNEIHLYKENFKIIMIKYNYQILSTKNENSNSKRRIFEFSFQIIRYKNNLKHVANW